MNFIKTIISLPILIVILTFAFTNNDLATFNLWPLNFEITVSLSVAIVFLIIGGFIFGYVFAWFTYVPEIREQKKENKKLNKAHNKLSEQVVSLQENLDNLKKDEPVKPKVSLRERIKDSFKRK